jgi:hypothetical protein
MQGTTAQFPLQLVSTSRNEYLPSDGLTYRAECFIDHFPIERGLGLERFHSLAETREAKARRSVCFLSQCVQSWTGSCQGSIEERSRLAGERMRRWD